MTLADRFADRSIRLGARTSPMAQAQAEHVANLLRRQIPNLEIEIAGIATSADHWEGDLAALGGKGAFTKEIDAQLQRGKIDAAVHCIKDVPGDVPLADGTVFAAFLEREDIHDVLVTPDGRKLADLPTGAVVGTSSVRRRAQLSLHRPDLTTQRVRGNVGTRLQKLDRGEYDALILARAGLARIGLLDRVTEVLDLEFMCPAIGAGVIGVQARTADRDVCDLLDPLNHGPTATHVLAERVMLHTLLGHCNSPIAGHAMTTPDRKLSLYGMVFSRDGRDFVRHQEWGALDDPASLGAQVGAALLGKGARRLIAATKK